MGGGASAGGGRAARALRLLLLLVLALAAVEYLFGSILDASPLRTYLYTPLYNATQPTLRNGERPPASIPKSIPLTNTANYEAFTEAQNVSVTNHAPPNNVIRPPLTANMTISKPVNITQDLFAINEATPTSVLITKIVEGMKNGTNELNRNDTSINLPVCETRTDLGPIPADKNDLELDVVEKRYPEVQWGGRYTPPNCTAKHKVAIIVPYRDRQQHLAVFLNHMHPFLMKQQIEYGIFIVEQAGSKQFNRAKLMNVGFVESQKLEPGGFQCFIFHDIDLLPLDTRNLYSCTRQPRHMSASIDTLNFKLPYEAIFGGVSAMTLEQFNKVNGFSNKYWGWGGEDDDMYYRLHKMNYHIARYKMSIARYAMLQHKKSPPNPKRYQLLSQTSKTFHKDGLSTLEYEVVQVMQYHLYTHILANIDERS
ncbi:beta-1,4-N-acetylgalactosaminyltransferase bre-4 [Helicoverpa zea]|uniref:beta-1,4-N-acetylgalactosaminyltransferase bre-4 n=1 Tax=Helicoverpa zea TaxID=7113 RepID=UPI001F59A854|nr:beta-1,4-N-acetylgalactosaminyltransferase bre-4 [Helicoverpa zea]